MQKFKKPISILLSVMMIVSLFTIVPITASAVDDSVENWYTSTTDKLNKGDGIYSTFDDDGMGVEGDLITIKDADSNKDITSRVTYWEADKDYVIVSKNKNDISNEYTGYDYANVNEYIFYIREAASTYTVTWKNEDGTELEKDENVAEGTTPTYDGATPYKADDATNIYTFSGWDPQITAVTADVEYTAQFTASAKPEAIKDCNNKFGEFRLYSNVPFVQNSEYNDLLDGAVWVPTYTDENTVIPIMDTKGYSYKFYDQTGTEIPIEDSYSSSASGSEYDLPDDVTAYNNVIFLTRPEGCKAIYIVATKLFAGHSITLGGNIGVNFFIDSAAADFDSAQTATVKFTWDGGEYNEEVDLKALTADNGYYKATVDVVAAQMAHKIHAEVFLDGNKLEETNDFSVQDYSDKLYINPEKYDSKKPEKLKTLAQALLNYGAQAQTVFDAALTEKPAPANTNVGENGFKNVTEEEMQEAINAANPGRTATDLTTVGADFGAKFYTHSLIYLSKNTLRIYFTPAEGMTMPHPELFDGNLSNYYYYVDKADIAAAELDNLQAFTVGETTFYFSALDYAKAVAFHSNMADAQKYLAKSLYLYNAAANEYFAPAPVVKTIVLDNVTEDTVANDGDTITGTLQGNYKITVADGATVTLKNANITSLSNNKNSTPYAGITPLGDATIILEGENSVKGGYSLYPGVYVPEDKTLTIKGDGKLDASSNGMAAGIGGGYGIACGNIVIEGGTVTATGGENSAGIGSGRSKACGYITISGGIVTATGGKNAAGIGSGNNASCEDITITDTVTKVTAAKGTSAPYSIGAGLYSTCGTVTIGGVEGAIAESPYTYPN